MDAKSTTGFRHRKIQSSDQFFTAFSHHEGASSARLAEDSEFLEDDIFSTGGYSSDPTSTHHAFHYSTSPSSASSSPSNRHGDRALPSTECSGILAALSHTGSNSGHLLRQKTNVSTSPSSSSSSCSSSSRLVLPPIPRPVQERTQTPLPYFKPRHGPQSAPVNVPILSLSVTRNSIFDEVEEGEVDGDEGDMLPPHEIVARAYSPMLACSVLEGVGRTLKGRDLRQVRNAVLRKTGFLD